LARLGCRGKYIRLESRDGTPVEIVGVAKTIKYLSTFDKPMDFVYMPLTRIRSRAWC